MKPVLWRYPLDRTGLSQNNFVAYERHSIGNSPRRAIAPLYGTFVADSLVLYDTQNQRQLTKSQYSYFVINREASKLVSKDAYYLVVITDKNVGSVVDVSYQAVGGEHSSFRRAIAILSETAMYDTRPVTWDSVSDKPSQFKPSKHMHDIGDMYGMQYTTHLVDQLNDLVSLRDVMTHDAIYRFIDTQYVDFGSQIDLVMQTLSQHISNTSDPHRVTPTQMNAFIYSEFDTLLANLRTTYNTRITADSNLIAAHIANQSNPHQLTAAKIDAYTAAEMEAKLQAVLSSLPPGNDGTYQYRGGTTGGSFAYSWSDTNDGTAACMYSLSVQGQGSKRVASRVYVNGGQITPAYNYHTGDTKCIQAAIFVPAGGSIYVDMNTGETPCRMLAFRFIPK